jgi:hypothetical protein
MEVPGHVVRHVPIARDQNGSPTREKLFMSKPVIRRGPDEVMSQKTIIVTSAQSIAGSPQKNKKERWLDTS